MAKNAWPAANKMALMGKRISRLDGPAKSTGHAKYAYDMNRPGMLYVRLLGSPHAAAKVSSINFDEAKKVPGVVEARGEIGTAAPDNEVRYAGEIIASVAASSEEAAREAISKIKVVYEVLPHLVDDTDPSKSDGKEQGE
ncbi:MAG: hypothetical protein SGI88_01775, partial [Candidatus Hydrogenedentes bacterium]|nr:hypothetical protein [Candidatus Hydrogenedentota bacterium]